MKAQTTMMEPQWPGLWYCRGARRPDERFLATVVLWKDADNPAGELMIQVPDVSERIYSVDEARMLGFDLWEPCEDLKTPTDQTKGNNMIKYYCDFCGEEITERNKIADASGRLTGHLTMRPDGERMNVQVMTGLGAGMNNGVFCKYCVIDAVKSLDDRPRR